MKKTVGTTPLASLNAVAIDLETTSLDVREARIVQVGAAHLNRGAINLGTAMEEVVNPGIKIPRMSTEIHGVTNDMAGRASSLEDFWPDLMAFLKGRVLIGHTIAYDLTVLERQARLYDLDWEKPRSLCIRHLARLVLENLHDPSLDRLATWFAIGIERRHSALCDAEAAGRIFLKLVPLLAERGIRTLAEAERVTLEQGLILHDTTSAGWVFPVVDPAQAALFGGGQSFDTYAYRHTLGDVMSSKPVVIGPNVNLQNAVEIMDKHTISSVLVCPTAEPGLQIGEYSILTERDAMRMIAKSGAGAFDEKSGTIASHPMHSIREKAFVYRAISRMQCLKIRHLAVVSETGALCGMVSARDLLRLRTDAAINLNDGINEAENTQDMVDAWGLLPAVVSSLIAEKLDAHTITQVISEEIRSMTARAAIIAQTEMAQQGLGAPPCPYAVIILGSGGRGESLIKPDQDNAIIFKNGCPGGPEDSWFEELGRRFTAILDEAGIPFCDGGVMARNAEWRGSVATWEKRIDDWTSRTRAQDLLNVDIFFDQIPVLGDRTLSLDLFSKSYRAGSSNLRFAKAMSMKTQRLSSPFGLFGSLKAQNNRLDLKLHGLFPLVTAARTLAISYNIALHSTRERLNALIARGQGDTSLMKRLIGDHGFILTLMLKSQGNQVASGKKATNFVDLGQLSREEKARLKEALSNIRYVPELVKDFLG